MHLTPLTLTLIKKVIFDIKDPKLVLSDYTYNCFFFFFGVTRGIRKQGLYLNQNLR